MINFIDCPCCEEKKENLNHSINYKNKIGKSEFDEELFQNRKIYLCENCGFSYSTPFIDNKTLEHFYKNSFARRRMRSMYVSAKRKFRFSLTSLQRIFYASAFLKKITQ